MATSPSRSLEYQTSSIKLGLRKCLIIFIFINYRGSAKWEAWSSKKGMDSETAIKEYIEMVEKMKEKHGMI